MASGHVTAPHKQAGHMAAPTSSALKSKKSLPTGSRPHMAINGLRAIRPDCDRGLNTPRRHVNAFLQCVFSDGLVVGAVVAQVAVEQSKMTNIERRR